MPDAAQILEGLINQGLSDRKIASLIGTTKSVPEYYRRQRANGKAVMPYKQILQVQWQDVWEPCAYAPSKPKREASRQIAVEKRERIRALVRVGLSQRKIAADVGCGKNTARRYMNLFRDEGPTCRHDINLYLCVPCSAMRRSISHEGALVFESGPHK